MCCSSSRWASPRLWPSRGQPDHRDHGLTSSLPATRLNSTWTLPPRSSARRWPMRGRRLSSRSARDSARCRFINGKAARQNCGKPQAHHTKEPLHASQACAQCYAQYDNRRAIIITALDAEAILRAGALLLRCSPPTRLSKVPAMPVFANLAHIPLGCSASQSHRLTLHACEDFMPDMA